MVVVEGLLLPASVDRSPCAPLPADTFPGICPGTSPLPPPRDSEDRRSLEGSLCTEEDGVVRA